MKIRKARVKKLLYEQMLTVSTLAGVVFGVIVGLILRASSTSKWSARHIMYMNFAGEIFLRMLKSLILPLIMSSLISAIGTLNLKSSGRIGGRAIAYYVITTVMAVILGIILVITIRPGVDRYTSVANDTTMDSTKSSPLPSPKQQQPINCKLRNTTTVDTVLDLIRNMFPPNIVQAYLEQYQTVLTLPNNAANSSDDDFNDYNIGFTYSKGMNVIGLVVSACVAGVALSSMEGKVATLLAFVTELSAMMMKITTWVIFISPIGIFFLTVSQIIEMDNLNLIAEKLSLYLITVIVGILIHGFVILPIIFYLFTRQNPYLFIVRMGQAIVMAFGTASSSATLPVTIQCLEEKNKVSPQVSRFMLPIGSTINMDGTALYEAVAAIFIAQLRGVPLSLGKVIAISITSTAASIGAAGIPQAGLVTLVLVLDTVGLPPTDVSLILTVDWILDRIRTVVNVLGDALGAGIVNHISRADLIIQSKQQQNTTTACFEIET